VSSATHFIGLLAGVVAIGACSSVDPPSPRKRHADPGRHHLGPWRRSGYRAAFAAAAAVLALATKNTHEDPAQHAAEADADQPQLAVGSQPTMDMTRRTEPRRRSQPKRARDCR
jgi:hypothetical protein